MDLERKTILFVCTHNSARSQMAEALVNHLYGDRYQAFSAGTEPTEVHPIARRAMSELGMDISRQQSKSIDRFLGQDFEWVVTLCDHAHESCPVFPAGYKRVHKGFRDPAAAEGDDEERLEAFRMVRDELKEWFEKTVLRTDE
ncbi:Protein ArsC [uncultured Desulfatiglans sp.]|nr:Protein ArsC [uncultured Desulfatiglans sp.]